MPYLSDIRARLAIDGIVNQFTILFSNNIVGHLNYFLFKLAKVCCCNYAQYAAFIGELESAKLEIYRRFVAPYEDKKIQENGDVE